MTPEQEQRLKHVEDILGMMLKSDRVLFEKAIQVLDGRNIQVGKTLGTIIGTESTQKLAFWAATPIVRPSAISAPSAAPAAYDQTVAGTWVTAINTIRTTLQNLGLTA